MMWRRIGFILLGVIALAVLAAGVARHFLADEAFLKRQAAETVQQATGRALDIEGPLRLELGRTTILRAEGLALANAPWAEPTGMIRIGRLELALDSLALLRGQWDLRSIAVHDCAVQLVKRANGDVNWDLFREARPDRPPPAESGRAIRLHRLQLTDCELAYETDGRAQPLSLRVDRVTLDPDGAHHWQWTVRQGKNRGSGRLGIVPGGLPALSGELRAEYLDLSNWMASEEAERGQADSGDGGERVFDETPVSRLVQEAVDLDLEFSAGRVDLGTSLIEDLALRLEMRDGALRIDPFRMRGEQGSSLSGRLVLDYAGPVPRLSAALDGRDVRVGLAAAPGQAPESYPPLEIQLQLEGSGASMHELAAGLNGWIRLYAGAGKIAVSGLDRLFSDFVTELFRTLNPLAERLQYTEVECAVIAAEITAGRVTVGPFVLQTRELTILSDGVIDLDTERLDLQFNTRPRTGIGISAGVLIKPLVKVGGTLKKPAVELDAKKAVITGGAAVATSGLSLLAKALSDRFLVSADPCGEARRAAMAGKPDPG